MGMMDRGEELDSDKVVVEDEKSFWIGHGTGDRVTSFETSKRWFQRLKAEDKVLFSTGKVIEPKFFCLYTFNRSSRSKQSPDVTFPGST